MKNKRFRWWRIPLALLLTLALLLAVYIVYLLTTYHRIEDNLPLEVRGTAREPAETDKEYTIVSYNIGFGAYTADFTFFMDGGKESRARSEESVLNCVRESAKTALSFDPDFVLFQEVDTGSTRSYQVDEAQLIQEAFDAQGDFDSVFAQNYHSAYLFYPFTKPHGASNSGLLTQSRADIASSLRRSLPIASGLKKYLDLDRCYSVSRIPVADGRELILVNAHLSAYGTNAGQGQAQMEQLFADLKKEYEQGNYVICGGDFNHDFTTNSKALLNPGNADTFSWCHPFPDELIPAGFSKCTDYADGLTATTRNTDIPYGEDSFTAVLDGFLVSDNVKCSYVQNIDTGFLYTDHNPVVMRFALSPAQG